MCTLLKGSAGHNRQVYGTTQMNQICFGKILNNNRSSRCWYQRFGGFLLLLFFIAIVIAIRLAFTIFIAFITKSQDLSTNLTPHLLIFQIVRIDTKNI